MRRKFSVRESLLDEYSLVVQPERDAVALVDMQSVQVQEMGQNVPDLTPHPLSPPSPFNPPSDATNPLHGNLPC